MTWQLILICLYGIGGGLALGIVAGWRRWSRRKSFFAALLAAAGALLLIWITKA